MHFYKKTLSKKVYTTQKQNALIADIRDSLQQCFKKLEEFAQEYIDPSFKSAQDEDRKLIILPQATNLLATQQFKQTNQLSEKQKKKKRRKMPHHTSWKIRNQQRVSRKTSCQSN